MQQVVRAPDLKLRVRTKPVKKITPEILKIIDEMIKLTKTFVDPEGVGLAATQIGRQESLFIAKLDNNQFEPFFNPKIISKSKKEKIFFEGCLSIPDYYGETTRPISILASYMDKHGRLVTKRLKGNLAWIFQHEIDHLNGMLFVDLVLQQKGKMYKAVGKDATGADIFEEVRL